MSSSARKTLLSMIEQNGKRMRKLTSCEFHHIWQKYDVDGSGYIDEEELEKFLRDYLMHVVGSNSGKNMTTKGMKELAGAFMETHDRNRDGKLSIHEMASLLPTDERFLLLFRFDNPVDSSQKFITAWKKYDIDKSGYIEASELPGLLRDIFQRHTLDEKAIAEYSKTIMEMFDTNKDGKLSLGEASRLLPVTNNFVRAIASKADIGKLSEDQINRIFDAYDQDKSGYLSGLEIDSICLDLVRLMKKDDFHDGDVIELKKAVIASCDPKNDGKIDRKEMNMVINAAAKTALKDQQQQ